MPLVQEFTQRRIRGRGRSGHVEDEVITKVKLYSALDALRLLAKHHALLTEVLAVKDLPKDERELDALIEHHLKRVYGPHKGAANREGAVARGDEPVIASAEDHPGRGS